MSPVRDVEVVPESTKWQQHATPFRRGSRATAFRLLPLAPPSLRSLPFPAQFAPTSYAGASAAVHAADLAAGLGLIGAGLLAWLEPRSRRLGLLAILAGVAWFGPDWEGWDGGPALVRSLGALAGPFFLAFVLHLVLTFPSGRSRSWPVRALVGAAYGIAAVVAVGLALFRDPFLDPVLLAKLPRQLVPHPRRPGDSAGAHRHLVSLGTRRRSPAR